LALNILNAQTVTVWDYDIKPGSAEWEAISTRDEMLKVIQIPNEVLNSINTEELAVLCINYPMHLDFYIYNSLQEGLERVVSDFNGLRELFERKDNVKYLLGLLRENDLEKLPIGVFSTVELGRMIVRQTLVELFLSNESVLANSTLEQQKEIASIAFRNMILKEQRPRSYSSYSLEASAYLLCANIKRINNNLTLPSELELFLSSGTFMNDGSAIIWELKQLYSKTLTQ